MDPNKGIGTGIEGLDRAIDGLRSGDTVLWQIAHIRDYIFAATQFVASTARDGQRIVYLRFGDHDEVIDAQALAERGANVKKYVLDPTVGFETFAVQVHRIVAAEGEGVFYIFDCITELQKYWFSDMMVCNFFCLTCPFLREQQSIAYVPILYEKHIYETVSRIRHAAPVLMNIRTMNAATYIHAVKVEGRRTEYMYFPIRIDGANCTLVTSSAESYGIFDIFTQTGERRDCWDSMFDFAASETDESEDAEAAERKDNIIRCLLGSEPQRFALCRKYFTTADLMAIKKREIGTRCIGKLNHLLKDEHTVLMGPGRWGTSTPSLGVPVNYNEVSKFDCMCELAYSSHGLRPELSYGSHFFQDLVEAGTFYTAIYRGEYGCVFNDALFDEYENCYCALLGDEAEEEMAKVIRVCDTEGKTILYSEIASQECFLARI